MARDPDLRVSDADRDRAITKLGEHAAAGRLTHEELEERGDRALAARTSGDIAALFADLPRRREQHRPRRRGRSNWKRIQLVSYTLVGLMFIVIWAASGAGYFWPIWPLAGWGIGIVASFTATPSPRRRGLPHGGSRHRASA
jgi:DUF1707 SHOCT-like domain/2TM domain